MTRPRIILICVFLALAAIVGAALIVPLGAFRGGMEAAASRALNRPVRIAGSIHLSVYPELGIAVRHVSVANAAGTHDPNMVEVGKIVVGAELMPLLAGHLRMTKLVLKQPVIHLEVGRDGVANWEPAARAAAPAPAPSAGVGASVSRLRIEGGEITYRDERTGKSDRLAAVSASASAPNPAAGARQFTIDGTATYKAATVAFNAKLGDAAAFLGGEPSDAVINLSSDLLTASFAGRIDPPATASGTVKLDTKSLRALAAWAGHPLPPGNGLGAMALNAAVSASQGRYALSGATISLDGMKVTGNLSLDTRQPVPAVRGTLALDHLNVVPYLAAGAATDAAKAPLSLSGLKAVDADVTLTTGPVTLPDIKLDRAALVAALHGGTLKTDFTSVAAYGGSGKATLTVETAGAEPAIHATLDMSGVRTERFLGEIMGIAKVSAGGAIRLDLASRGRSEAEIVRDLSGKGSVDFTNGTISGVDLGAVAHLVQTAERIVGGAVGGSLKTEFNTLSCNFTLQNAVMRTNDLRLVSPALQLTGAGTLNLVNRQLDFRLSPQANLRVAGVKLADIGIPFFVRGTLDNPSFAPDPAGIPKALGGALGGTAGRVLKVPGGTLKSILNGIR